MLRLSLLLVALVLLGQVYGSGAPVCNGNGVDLSGFCTCFSGFTGGDCATDAHGSCLLPTARPLVTSSVAELMGSQSGVADNVVSLVVRSPLTEGRYFEYLRVGSPACNYPHDSDNVAKTVDVGGCYDVFTAHYDVPNLVNTCGFTAVTAGGYFNLGGSVQVSVVDPLSSFRGGALERTTRSLLNVNVRIPTTVNATSTNLLVFSQINVDAAISRQEYDYPSDTITIELTTAVSWPYKLTTPAVSGGASGLTLGELTLVDSSQCVEDASGSICFQTHRVQVTPVRSITCDFGGNYQFDFHYTCRAGQSPCPVTGADSVSSISATLASGDICATVTVDAHITGDLTSSQATDFSTEDLAFVFGSTLYFKATFSSDVAIQSVIVNDVNVRIPNDRGSTLVNVPTASKSLYSGTVSSITDPTQAGFSFQAVSSIFPVTDGTPTIFQVEASFQITYSTSFKRDVVSQQFSLISKGVLLPASSEEANSASALVGAGLPVVFAAGALIANQL